MERVAIATALRARWPEHTAKRVASAASAPVATVKDWLNARRTMAADALLRIMVNDQHAAAEIMREMHALRDARAAAKAASVTGIGRAPACKANSSKEAMT